MLNIIIANVLLLMLSAICAAQLVIMHVAEVIKLKHVSLSIRLKEIN